jgi:hypothetical protein
MDGIEPKFYEELYTIATQVPCPNHIRQQTHPNLTNLITINLQFFLKVMFFNQVIVFLWPKTLSFPSIILDLNLAYN